MNPVLAAQMQKRASDELKTRIHLDGEKMHIQRQQDCTPIAEYAKRASIEGLHGSSEMRHVAKIPNVIIEKYCNERGVSFAEVIGDPAHMRRIVNDPDNAMFRIWPGKI